MAMPSDSLTTTDKVLIQFFSAILFALSSIWCNSARSVGISNFPLGFALFCKYARPFASAESRAKLMEDRKKFDAKADASSDPLEDPSFVKLCLMMSIAQLLCVVSGIFDWYASIIIQGTVIFRILLSVQDSIQSRPIKTREEERRQKRREKEQLESAQFWRFILPSFLWKWWGFEKIVAKATSSKSDQQKKEDTNIENNLVQKVHTAKQLIRGKRETALHDLIWGMIEIAYVAFDVTHKQAIGTAFLVYLCTLMEDVLTFGTNDKDHPRRIKKVRWLKIAWMSVCVYFTGKWCFS